MYQLAEVNIARMLAPLDSPLMADFVAQLDAINALADASSGFVWRLQTSEGNASALRPYEDDRILVNLSLWTDLPALSTFVYKSQHRPVLQQRSRWFERLNEFYMALWWVPSGQLPTVEEAKERLDYLRTHGESPYAFSFKKPFEAAAAINELPTKACHEVPSLTPVQ